MVGWDWWNLILIIPVKSCSLCGSLWYRFPDVVFLDRWHPRVGKFNSVIPVDVFRVRSYVDSLFNATRVPVLVPQQIMAGLVAEMAEVWVRVSRISLLCSSRPHRLIKISSKQSKHCDLHLK